jgi:2-polyprenyl-3-methyl-5-hydroxy-6-metoxy-1,4-benzoquinol methylase
MSENNALNYEQQLEQSRQIWNVEAASFDSQPDHGLHDSTTLAAWTALLKTSLPSGKGKVLDIGCGTGSLSVVLAGLGYEVTGIDFSPEMIARAEAKAQASHHPIKFHVMDGTFPQFPQQQFDAIVCRHLLWALPETDQVLERWVRLLKPEGRLLLIEGYWHTNAGLHAQQIVDALPTSLADVSVQSLSDQDDLWGSKVQDERYAVTARLRPT